MSIGVMFTESCSVELALVSILRNCKLLGVVKLLIFLTVEGVSRLYRDNQDCSQLSVCRGASANDTLDGVLTPYVQACSNSTGK